MNFREVIMGWKHMDTWHVVTHSTREHFENLDEVDPSKKSKEEKMSCTDIFISD